MSINKTLLTTFAAGVAGVALLMLLRRTCGGSGCGKRTTNKASTETQTTKKQKKLDAIVISGPSGVGKGTIINRLRSEYPNAFGFSVSHTTRAPRTGETDGKEYHFTTKEKIEVMIANGEFLESCNVHGNIYGTSKAALAAVQAEGKVPIIEMDVQGAQKLKGKQGSLNFHYLFITAPSMKELEARIRGRGSDSEEKIQVRLDTARKEDQFLQANPAFFNTVLANDNLDVAFTALVELLKSLGVEL